MLIYTGFMMVVGGGIFLKAAFGFVFSIWKKPIISSPLNLIAYGIYDHNHLSKKHSITAAIFVSQNSALPSANSRQFLWQLLSIYWFYSLFENRYACSKTTCPRFESLYPCHLNCPWTWLVCFVWGLFYCFFLLIRIGIGLWCSNICCHLFRRHSRRRGLLLRLICIYCLFWILSILPPCTLAKLWLLLYSCGVVVGCIFSVSFILFFPVFSYP